MFLRLAGSHFSFWLRFSCTAMTGTANLPSQYGIDRNSPDEIRQQQAEKGYKELYARFETMIGLRSSNKKDDTTIRKECRQPAYKDKLYGKVRIPVSPNPKRRKMGL